MTEYRPLTPAVHAFALGVITMLLVMICFMLVNIYEVLK